MQTVYFKFLKHFYGELMHTNHNSVYFININIIIMKVIPQPADTENS